MKKLALLGGAAGIGLCALFGSAVTPPVQAADHLDGTLSVIGVVPMADLNDVYAWNSSDGASLNLALTVSPNDPGTRAFGPSVSYQFHVTSRPGANGIGMAGVESKIICTFVSNTNGSCWVVNPTGTVLDYVTGDLSAATGRTSASGKFRVFAGQRSDPFFFNLAGFKRAVGAALTTICTSTACPGNASADAAGCLDGVTKAQGDTLRALISTESTVAVSPCAANQIDCFENFNVMAIVVQVDKTEVLRGTDKIVSVWASTHAAP